MGNCHPIGVEKSPTVHIIAQTSTQATYSFSFLQRFSSEHHSGDILAVHERELVRTNIPTLRGEHVFINYTYTSKE